MHTIDTQHVDKLASLAASLQTVIDEIRGPEVVVSAEIQEAVDYYVKHRICLRCEQKKAGRYTRGLDANCYNMTIKEINAGEARESDLIRMGRITAVAQAGGRKSATPKHSQLKPLRPLPPERQQSQDEDDALTEFTEAGQELEMKAARARAAKRASRKK